MRGKAGRDHDSREAIVVCSGGSYEEAEVGGGPRGRCVIRCFCCQYRHPGSPTYAGNAETHMEPFKRLKMSHSLLNERPGNVN